jgi:Ca2+-binding EF-hand superfamily protein
MTIANIGVSSHSARLDQLREAMFKTADADGDGQLSLSEFQSVGQNVQGQGERRGPPPMRAGDPPGGRFGSDTLSALLSTQSVDEVAGSVMEAGDADGDGLLSAEEISTALSAKASDETANRSALAAKIVAALDGDGDGSISTSELSTAISDAATRASEWRQAQGPQDRPPGPPPSADGAGASGVFETLDVNRDGVVSAEEMAGAEGSAGAEATSAAGDLIKTSDQDGDGALSGGEFYALFEKARETPDTADATATFASLMSGSTAAVDLMQKLLAQLDSALSNTSNASNTVSATA